MSDELKRTAIYIAVGVGICMLLAIVFNFIPGKILTSRLFAFFGLAILGIGVLVTAYDYLSGK